MKGGKKIKHDPSHIRKGDNREGISIYKVLAEKYLAFIDGTDNLDNPAKFTRAVKGGTVKLANAVKEAVAYANKVLNKLASLNFAEDVANTASQDGVVIDAAVLGDINALDLIDGHALGRIIEKFMAYSISKKLEASGLSFSHGSEAKNQKDINCDKFTSGQRLELTPDEKAYLKANWVGPHKGEDFANYPGFYGIELKCAQINKKTNSLKVTGNKSYAVDQESNKHDKSAFYIIFNYVKPTADSPSITGYNTYFGFLDQSDWLFSENGNASTINTKVLLDKRLIKID